MLWRAIIVVLSAIGVPGCFRYIPVTFRVVDAETGEPVKGAVLKLGSRYDFKNGSLLEQKPFASGGRTGADGTAVMSVAWDYQRGQYLEVASEDYFRTIKSDPLPVWDTESQVQEARREQVVEVRMLKLPRPTVELVVPSELRGWIRVGPSPDPGPPGVRGPRDFVICFLQAREVALPADHALHHSDRVLKFRARTNEGRELRMKHESVTRLIGFENNPDPPDHEVLVWLSSNVWGGYTFFVGTREDFIRARGKDYYEREGNIEKGLEAPIESARR